MLFDTENPKQGLTRARQTLKHGSTFQPCWVPGRDKTYLMDFETLSHVAQVQDEFEFLILPSPTPKGLDYIIGMHHQVPFMRAGTGPVLSGC